jgi:hypothetical protein
MLQVTAGTIVALFLLSYIIWQGATLKALIAGHTLSTGRGPVSVFMMGCNMAIGGQAISKATMGLLSFRMGYSDETALPCAALVRLVPLAALFGPTRLFPLREAWAA